MTRPYNQLYCLVTNLSKTFLYPTCKQMKIITFVYFFKGTNLHHDKTVFSHREGFLQIPCQERGYGLESINPIFRLYSIIINTNLIMYTTYDYYILQCQNVVRKKNNTRVI